jgi:hypothetical protein
VWAVYRLKGESAPTNCNDIETVARVQVNAVAFRRDDPASARGLGWLRWQKAEFYTFDDKGFETYLPGREPGTKERRLRYEYITPPA